MSQVSPLYTFIDPDIEEGALWLTWLVRLRWLAVAAQLVTLSFTFRLLESPTLLLPLIGVMIALVISNLQAQRALANKEHISQWRLAIHLATEIVALTVFFLLAGGPDNPFVVLLLNHVAMGGVMLRRRKAIGIIALVLVCYAILHMWAVPLHPERHLIPVPLLMTIGKTVAFSITAISVGAFVLGLSRTLRAHRQQLLESRDRSARTDRLRAVGTLAAGAAHELNTPLSTIDLRLRRIGRRHHDVDTGADLDVLKEQLDRCKKIVDQLLIGAGDPSASTFERRALAELVWEGVNMWCKSTSLEVKFDDHSDDLVVELPTVAFTQALINLLENAREAQESVANLEPLEVKIEREGDMGVVYIRDHGCGLPDDTDMVGDPFFTTKASGTGLGVYVARQVADGAGGGLSYTASGSSFTEARWWFPQATRRSQ